MPAGRKPKISFEHQKILYNKYKSEIVINNEMVKFSNPNKIFLKISKEIEMSPQAVYLFMKKIFEIDRKSHEEILSKNDEGNDDMKKETNLLNAIVDPNKLTENTKKDDSFYEVAESLNLFELKQHAIYKEYLKFVGADPFYAIYFSKSNQYLYDHIYRTEKTLNILIDSTETLCATLRPTDKMSLTTVILSSKSCSNFNVAYLLASLPDENLFEFYFKEFLNTFKIPQKIVLIYEKTLLNGVIKGFTSERNTKSYLKTCAAILNGEIYSKPEVFVGIDIIHFHKTIQRSSYLNTIDMRVRNFVLRVISYLTICEDFNVAKRIIQDLFTVILNKYDGIVNGVELPAEAARSRLINLTKTHFYFTEDISFSHSNLKDNFFDDDDDVNWVSDLIYSVEISTNGRDNLYYVPQIVNYLRNIFFGYPLWSVILNTIFDECNNFYQSVKIDESFEHLKFIKYNNGELLDANDFVKLNIDYDIHFSSIIKSEINNDKNEFSLESDLTDKTDDSENIVESLLEENWRNKNRSKNANIKIKKNESMIDYK